MSTCFDSIVVVIPAYEPSEALVSLVADLWQAGLNRIVLVNDGSADNRICGKIAETYPLTLLQHEENRGKGAALKTAFRYILEQPAYTGVRTLVTVDADGQHLPEDVLLLARSAVTECSKLLLGVREFTGSVPIKSAVGNRMTRLVLAKAAGIQLRDTQTGLRAIPTGFARQCLDLRGNRYEFELESIVLARDLGWPIVEIPITTVYEGKNETSHFNPLLDSLRVYAVFSRYLLVSMSSFVIDIGLFALFFGFSGNIFLSTYAARACSSAFNFLGNKIFAFRSHGRQVLMREALGYLLLVIASASLSAVFVYLAHAALESHVVIAKIVVDSFIFFMNFLIQRKFLFRTGHK